MIDTNPDFGQRIHPRHKVLMEGKIISTNRIVSANANSVIDVKVRDLSDGGARIQIPVDAELPEEFCVLIVSEDKLYPAVAKWRLGEMAGIAFIGKPRSASQHTWK
jgi:hypothetical protein